MIYQKELNKIGSMIIKQGHTVAVAESVTAGLIQNIFANVENASIFFQGGITAYNIHQKCTHLFMDPVHAIGNNCVSEKIAEEMAVGICKSFKSTWGLAVTGYASPIPEQGLEDLYACYAFCFRNEIVKHETVRAALHASPGKVQQFYMKTVVEDFIQSFRLIEKLS